MFALIGLLLAMTLPLAADGGTLRVANVPMGAYRVNVFTDPTPIPPDSIDVSALVTFERGRGVATGLEIEVLAAAWTFPARPFGDWPPGSRRRTPGIMRRSSLSAHPVIGKSRCEYTALRERER